MTEELIHIRCVTCGKVVANLWEKYKKLLSTGVRPGDAMDQLGLTRYCCRRTMMSPFKLISNVDRQEVDVDVVKNKLSVVNTGVNNNMSPLTAVQPITNSLYGTTILPTIGDESLAGVTLPDIPTVDLPEVQPGGQVEDIQSQIIQRQYQAW